MGNNEHAPSTLEGMVTLSDNKEIITIGMDGMYRVSADVYFDNGGHGAAHYLQIMVKDATALINQNSTGGGWGHMEVTVALQANDQIHFHTNHIYASNQQHNRFTIQKL